MAADSNANTTPNAHATTPQVLTAWLLDNGAGPAQVAPGTHGARPVYILDVDGEQDAAVLPAHLVPLLLAGDPAGVVLHDGFELLDLGEHEDMALLAPGQLEEIRAALLQAVSAAGGRLH